MKLFNKYKNKNFAFITNYINSCVNDDSLALTEEDIKEQLSGASQSSFEEFLLALTNACDTSKSYNVAILYHQNDVMMPLRQIPIPVRLFSRKILVILYPAEQQVRSVSRNGNKAETPVRVGKRN